MRFLFVDRILSFSPGKVIRGIKHVTHDDYYLTRAANGRPCFIPSLIGETLGQLAAWNVMACNDFTRRPVAGIVSSAQLLRPVYVGETLLLESVIDSLDDESVRYHSVAYVGNEAVFRVNNALGPMLPMHEFIDDITVRRQFAEINRPGELPDYQNQPSSALSDRALITPLTCMTFDVVTLLEPGERMTAEKHLSFSAPYFPDHFPQKPVLPMTVLLECQLNLALDFINQSHMGTFEVREMRKIKMNAFVLPGDVLHCQLSIKRRSTDELVLACRSEVDGRRVCVLDIVMSAKDTV